MMKGQNILADRVYSVCPLHMGIGRQKMCVLFTLLVKCLMTTKLKSQTSKRFQNNECTIIPLNNVAILARLLHVSKRWVSETEWLTVQIQHALENYALITPQ